MVVIISINSQQVQVHHIVLAQRRAGEYKIELMIK